MTKEDDLFRAYRDAIAAYKAVLHEFEHIPATTHTDDCPKCAAKERVMLARSAKDKAFREWIKSK